MVGVGSEWHPACVPAFASDRIGAKMPSSEIAQKQIAELRSYGNWSKCTRAGGSDIRNRSALDLHQILPNDDSPFEMFARAFRPLLVSY